MRKIEIKSVIPDGWVIKVNGNAPIGHILICNNKSIFGIEYKNAYVKIIRKRERQ